MLKYGNISAIDPTQVRARVEFAEDEIVSAWLPITVQGSGRSKYFRMFAVGEHVACMMDERCENGVILGAIYDQNNQQGDATATLTRIDFGQGSVVEYDSSTKIARVTVGKNVFEISELGFAIKKSGESLKTILTDLLTANETETHGTPAGPSTPPVNVAVYSAIKARILAFFTS